MQTMQPNTSPESTAVGADVSHKSGLTSLFGRGSVFRLRMQNSMKYTIAFFCSILLITTAGLPSVLAEGVPTSAEQLRSEFETALKAKDTNSLMQLIYWQGVSDGMKTMVGTEIANLSKTDFVAVKLLPLPVGFQATNELNGIRYGPSVTVIGLIDVEFAKAGNSMQLPYGKSGDAFYVSCTVEEKIPGPFTRSKTLNIMVLGTADMKSISGSCIFVQNGKEIEKNLSKGGTGFFGDYIKSCTIRKNPDAGGTIQLIIEEDGKRAFDSQEITNNQVVYEKK